MCSSDDSREAPTPPRSPFDYTQAMEYLVQVVQDLSLAHDLDQVMLVVRQAARRLTGADGATFVLRDRDECFYADEDAIEPLWKGHRFPIDICISGWVMKNRAPVVIEDIFADARIPVEIYRPTFVRSLAMVPIRTLNPVGALGTYWRTKFRPSLDQVRLLHVLADTTAVALDSAKLYSTLETRVKERTAQLEAANEQIRQLSLTDELTGLYNRRGFTFLAEQHRLAALRDGLVAWVLFADIDGLKPVNDRLGHEAGDRLLCTAASLLREAFRKADIVARFGGDEFAVFGTSHASKATCSQRLNKLMLRHNSACAPGLELSMSSGFAESGPGEDIPLEELIRRADEAMYVAKRSRRTSA